MKAKPKQSHASRSAALASLAPASRGWWVLIALVTAVFAAVRLRGALNDLWLDEILSVNFVSQITSPLGVFTQLFSDNNHPLNSLFIFLLAPVKADWTFRLLALATGTATIPIAAAIARRQFHRLHPDALSRDGDRAGLLTAVLFGSCYLLIHYSSEARGYAPAVCFSLLAFYSLLRAPAGGLWSAWAVLYWVACVLGVTSHLLAVQMVLAGVVWSAIATWRASSRWRDRFLHLTAWHLVPCAFLALFYVGFVRKLEILGGPQNQLSQVLGDLAAYTLGLPHTFGVLVALPVLVGTVAIALAFMRRRQDWALVGLYVTAIVAAPVLALGSSRFVLLFPRYFIISAAFALLLAGYALALLWRGETSRRLIGAAIVALFVGGNGVHDARLIQDGRGQYTSALRYVADHTPTGVITVSSDHDFRNSTVIAYYAPIAIPSRTLRYISNDAWPPAGPQWIFIHKLDDDPVPESEQKDDAGHVYTLQHVFRHAALSGWDWFVYRNRSLLPDSAGATRSE